MYYYYIKNYFFILHINLSLYFIKLTYIFSYIMINLYFLGQGVTILMVQAYIIVEQALKEV